MAIPRSNWGYVPALDGLRAIAVLLVVGFHRFGDLLPGGYIGVDIFFVLSGLLITRILVSELDSSGRVSLRGFYRRRALRLLPALLVLCAVMAVVVLAFAQLDDRDPTWLGIVGALTYSSSVLAAGGHRLGAFLPTWSLSVEEFFYVLWPLALVGLARWSRRRLPVVVAGLAVLAAAYTVFARVVLGFDDLRMAYAADTRAVQLMAGGAIGLLLPWVRARLTTRATMLIAICLVAFVMKPAALLPEFYFNGGSIIVAVLAAVLVGYLAGSTTGPFVRALSWAPLVWIGKRSYGIYLWNLPVVALVRLTSWSGPWQFVVKAVLSIAIPALSYAFVELYFLRRKGRERPGQAPSGDAASESPTTVAEATVRPLQPHKGPPAPEPLTE
jgi:peptidoglycan/LPS O-acetylase OafA/YrhL